jgi:succinate dehydrogenase/fumarate reductase flavoprotein subunit
MPTEQRAIGRHRDAEALDVLADVLVIGGGPAGAWAAVAATEAGARVVLVDKGYLGTSGATAPSNTGTWFVPPGEGRRVAIEQRQPRTGGLADPRWVERTLDTAWEKLHCLYAAGDAATRERLTGAISGGGGPNSAWAIASGNWAGRAAAMFAARIDARIADRPVSPLGQAGLRPAGTVRDDLDAHELVRTVREEMLPLDRNFFRREVTLRQSLDRLDACWSDLRHHGRGEGLAAVKLREAAALAATSRWAYRSALARAESRGMHRRRDIPGAHAGFACSLQVSGLGEIRVARADDPTIAAAS